MVATGGRSSESAAPAGTAAERPGRLEGGLSATQLDFAVLLTERERAALVPPETRFGTLPELPALPYALSRLRPDLFKAFDLKTVAGYAGLWLWVVRDGRRETGLLDPAMDTIRDRLVRPVQRADAPPVTFPWMAALLWLDRPDVQEAYPMADAAGVAAFLGWFLRQGIFEARCCDVLPDDHVALLIQPAQGAIPPPTIRFLDLLYATRPDLQTTFDNGSFEGRRAFMKWFFETGITEYPMHPTIVSAQEKAVFEWGETLKPAAPSSAG